MRTRKQSAGLVVRAMVFGFCVPWGLAGCGDALDHRPAVWEYISPAILQPNCATASCHSQAAAVAGLDFSTPERGYSSLTRLWVWIVDPNGSTEAGCRPHGDEFVCQREHRPLVTAYNPAQSRLVHMMRAQGARRMPPDRPLTEADIALIEHWILNGARKRGDDAPPDAAAIIDAGDGGGSAAADVINGGEAGAGEAGDAARADGPEAGAGSGADGGPNAG